MVRWRKATWGEVGERYCDFGQLGRTESIEAGRGRDTPEGIVPCQVQGEIINLIAVQDHPTEKESSSAGAADRNRFV